MSFVTWMCWFFGKFKVWQWETILRKIHYANFSLKLKKSAFSASSTCSSLYLAWTQRDMKHAGGYLPRTKHTTFLKNQQSTSNCFHSLLKNKIKLCILKMKPTDMLSLKMSIYQLTKNQGQSPHNSFHGKKS